MPDADPFDLERFVTAQVPIFTAALDELRLNLNSSSLIAASCRS